MEDTPRQQPDNPTPEQPSVDGLIEQRNRYHEVFDELDALAAKLRTAEVQAVIDTLLQEHDPHDEYDQMNILLKHGKDMLPDSYYELLGIYTRLLREFGFVEDTLTDAAMGNGEFAAYVRNEAQELLGAIDTMKLYHGGYSQEEQSAITLAKENLQRVMAESDMSDEAAELRYERVERSREILEAMHILRSSAEHETERNEPRQYDLNELYRAYALNQRYRTHESELHPDAAQDRPLLPTHLWQVTLTDDQRAYLERHLRAIDAEKEIARLEVEGLDLLPFALTTAEVKGFLRDIPGIAFEGVTRLSFKERPPEDADVRLDETDTRWVSLAVHSHDTQENSAQITVWIDAIEVRYEKMYRQVLAQCASQAHPDVSARAAATAHTIRHLKDTIVHEFGHAFHYKLPVGLLHDWDVAVAGAEDDQPVSQYVEIADTLEPDTYHVEDFADSFKLCLLRPGELAHLASVRYAAMQALISSCRP
jgi:hypothetical protein